MCVSTRRWGNEGAHGNCRAFYHKTLMAVVDVHVFGGKCVSRNGVS